MASIGRLSTQRKALSAASGDIGSSEIYRAFGRVMRLPGVSGDLLDFGSRNGALATRFNRSGRFRSVTAVDLMPRPSSLDASIDWVRMDLNEPTTLGDDAFDVVIAAEVIEHLENPRAVVREWFRLLRTGGTLVFSTHNNESWRSLCTLLVAGHFADFRDRAYPGLISALLRKDIERLLFEAGFSSPKFEFTNVGSVPKMPQLHWQTISAGLLRGVRFSDNLLTIAHKT